MNAWIRSSLITCCALVFAHLMTVQPAYGDIITGTWSLPGAGSSKTFVMQGGMFDPDPRLTGCVPLDQGVDVAPYSSDFKFVRYFSPFSDFAVFIIQCGDFEADFNFVPADGTALLDPNNFMVDPPNGVITTQVHLSSNTTGRDLSAFTDATFTVFFTGVKIDPNEDGHATWGPFGPPRITFQLASIPEPASLTLAFCGLVVAAGMAWSRRHREDRG